MKLFEEKTYYSISEAAQMMKNLGYDCSISLLRKFEREKVIDPPKHIIGKRKRAYRRDELETIADVLHLRLIGISISNIKELHQLLNYYAELKSRMGKGEPIQELSVYSNEEIFNKYGEDIALILDRELSLIHSSNKKILKRCQEFQNVYIPPSIILKRMVRVAKKSNRSEK